MTVEQLASLAKTTLDGAINNSVTSLVVTSATNVPATGNFRLLVQDSETDETNRELMLVGARAGTTLSSITRGIEGTAGVSHGNGSFVAVVLTAAGLEQFVEDNNAAQMLYAYQNFR